MNMKLYFFLLSILLISNVSAIQINPTHIFNTSASNSSIIVAIPVYMDKYEINSRNVLFSNLSYNRSRYVFNISTVTNWSTPNAVLYSIGFPNVDSASSKQINISSNFTQNLTLKLTNISVDVCTEVFRITYLSSLRNFTKIYDLGDKDYRCSGLNELQINITGIENTNTTTFNKLTIEYDPEEVAHGGGGSGGIVADPTADAKLCNLTYDYIQLNGKNLTKVSEFIIETQKSENILYSSIKVNNHITNWQLFCSDLVLKSLEPKIVCDKAYHLIIDTNNKYTAIDIMDAQSDLASAVKVSTKVLTYYTNNYENICSKLINKNIPFNLQQERQIEYASFEFDCDTNLNNTFAGFNLDASIPLWDIYKAGLTCEQVNTYKKFFAISPVSDGYKIDGLKSWVIVAPITILFMVLGFRALVKINARK